MPSTLRTAVIGCGGAGTNHAMGYMLAEGAELVAVCDLDRDRALTLAEKHDVPWTDTVDGLLESHEPDLVSVATPEQHHVSPTTTALAGGADVLCEKIMADSVAGAEKMVETAADHGRTLAVNYNYRHMPAFAAVATAVTAGDLGSIRLVSADVHAYGWHHVLDQLRFLLGDPVAVQATTVDDRHVIDERFHFDGPLYIPTHAAGAALSYGNDTIATASSSIHSNLADHLIDLAVTGEDGRVRITGMTPDDSTGQVAAGPLRDELEAVESITLTESFYRSVAAVVDALHHGDAPPTSGEDGLRLVELETAIQDAANTGEVVYL